MQRDDAERSSRPFLLLAAAGIGGFVGWLGITVVTVIILMAVPILIAMALSLRHDRPMILGAFLVVALSAFWPVLWSFT